MNILLIVSFLCHWLLAFELWSALPRMGSRFIGIGYSLQQPKSLYWTSNL